MRALFQIVRRDVRLGLRQGGDALTLVLFFVMVAVIVPFAIGPDRAQLARLAPGIVWIAAFLSMLLGLDRLFRADAEDGTLLLLRFARQSMAATVLGRMLAHWLLTALPLLLASPLLAVLLGMDADAWWRSVLSLLAGTPALVGFGTFAAAVTISLRHGGLLAPILVLPLCVPVLIFGAATAAGAAGSPLLLLLALSLLSTAFAPFAAALALRLGED